MKVELRKIYKSFGNVEVLKGVNLTINHGEIHALMGENGAGKSTLINVLTGVYMKNAGEILIDDQVVEIKRIRDSQNYKIAYVYQELNNIKEMSVLENMFLGHEIKSGLFTIDYAQMKQIAEDKLALLGVDIDVDKKMKHLSVGYQQMVEIAKSLIHDAELIILDEPTAALTNKETDNLFKVVKKLQKQGKSFLYVSHRMEEIFELCERITVLRDGQYIGTKNIADTNISDLVEMMVGRSINNLISHKPVKSGKEAIKVNNLTINNQFENISFKVHEGEIFGISGLMGAGRTEVLHALFGHSKLDAGEIEIFGKKVNIDCPKTAKKLGIAFVTEDRKDEGLIVDFDLVENTVLPSLDSLSNHHLIDKEKNMHITTEGIKNLNIKTSSPYQKLKNLSGGNQQKVVFAKWLATKPKILILDEPTRGVDVGAKKEIYHIINELKKQGVAIILVSSELVELTGICDRISVMYHGKLVHSINDRNKFSKEEILSYSFMGGK